MFKSTCGGGGEGYGEVMVKQLQIISLQLKGYCCVGANINRVPSSIELDLKYANERCQLVGK